jgi:hypothetical protein
MKNPLKTYKFPANILLILGFIDIFRGFLHTFEINWAAVTFAKLDLSFAANDQLFLLGIFGISNILTGLLYILISRKAKEITPYVLLIIPLSYLIGLIGLRLSGITPASAFEGKYFMYVYFATCIITSGIFFYRKYFKR